VDKGHGRKEVRQLISTTALNDLLDWPGVGQVFELERVRALKGKTEVEAVYGITSLRRDAADAAALLGLARGHWGIENGLHHVRDVTLGEDKCRVRTGNAPQVLAALRNAAVHLLEGVEADSKAAATRRFNIHPEETFPLLFT
jgi:predicted transposase YbfD/YdcC